jgi:hypothetical protein
MSAFMVADETINRVVGWLSREVYQSSYLKEKAEKTLGITIDSDAWAETVGKAMFQLNIDGVNDRYGDGEAKKFRTLNYTFIPAQPTTIYNLSTKIQVLMSMQCWLYQCSEGEVVKQPLYQFFQNEVEPHLMSSIINDLPEYSAAEWG